MREREGWLDGMEVGGVPVGTVVIAVRACYVRHRPNGEARRTMLVHDGSSTVFTFPLTVKVGMGSRDSRAMLGRDRWGGRYVDGVASTLKNTTRK